MMQLKFIVGALSMNKCDGWLVATTRALRPEAKARVVAGFSEKTADAYLHDFEHPDPSLTAWQRTSTTNVADDVNPRTSAAILPKALIGDDHLPRVPGWRKVLAKIAKDTGCRDRAFVRDLLIDIEFQHHRSTNGRWNSSLKRFERYAVRSVDDWCLSGINNPDERKAASPRVGKRTFHRIKDRLSAMGLIDASSHLWQGKTCLWIRPTEALSRILFDGPKSGPHTPN
jgi:hypothetical protein